MTSNKTTVTITELCENHWPEGCAHFERHRGVVVATGERLEVFSFYLDPADKDDDGCDLLICCESKRRVAAAVAAQHFDNIADKCEDLLEPFETGEEPEFKALIEKRTVALKDCNAWKELCHDL